LLELNESKGKEWGGDVKPPVPPRTGERTQTALWVSWGLLVVALVAVAAYGYRNLRQANIQLSQIPQILKSDDALVRRVTAAEEQMEAWTSDLKGLKERVVKLDRQTHANFQLARKHAEELSSQLEQRVQERMNERETAVNGRLNKLESSQETAQQRLARLDEELASLKQEIAAVRQGTDDGLAGLQQRLDGGQRELSALSQRLDHRRLDFELPARRETELAPGISVTVTGTDVRFQHFNGWVRLADEGQTVWVSRQSIRQPVIFYRQQDGARCELVATHVAGNSVAGYLLLPAASSTGKPLAQAQVPTRGSGL
jgi:septal ring factor EnvC (AmiA/AmiB activator)